MWLASVVVVYQYACSDCRLTTSMRPSDSEAKALSLTIGAVACAFEWPTVDTYDQLEPRAVDARKRRAVGVQFVPGTTEFAS